MGCITKRIYCRGDVKPFEPKQKESENICDFFADVISVRVDGQPSGSTEVAKRYVLDAYHTTVGLAARFRKTTTG